MKKLAITISGAVSLGAFEAGVMYEILRALKQHNNDPRTTADQKIVIDVLTGASAGGMTAAIAAQKLLFDAGALDDVSHNAFYLPWVVDINLAGLLALNFDEPASASILSSQLVESIASEFLTDRYLETPPAAQPHPAAAPQLYLGLALSNLNGVDYSIPLITGDTFVYTKFQDQFSALLSNGPADDKLDRWEPIRQAAVACGAFPFAFQVKELQRDLKTDYPDAASFPQTHGKFAYTDGGLFNNEPLGMAKNLVDKLDPSHLSHDSRYYLFVAPDLRGSAVDSEFNAQNATLLSVAERVVSGVFNQSRYQDWVQVETVNHAVAELDGHVRKIVEQIKGRTLMAASLAHANGPLLEAIYPDLSARNGALARLEAQYSDEVKELVDAGIDRAEAEEFIKFIAVLEASMGVQNYDKMSVYAITAGKTELAGSALYAFGGFFNENYRQHDYAVGRLMAQQFIAEQNDKSAETKSLGPIYYTPDPNHKPVPDPAYGKVTLDSMPRNERKILKDQVQGRIDDLLQELKVNWLERRIASYFVIADKLNALFGL